MMQDTMNFLFKKKKDNLVKWSESTIRIFETWSHCNDVPIEMLAHLFHVYLNLTIQSNIVMENCLSHIFRAVYSIVW